MNLSEDAAQQQEPLCKNTPNEKKPSRPPPCFSNRNAKFGLIYILFFGQQNPSSPADKRAPPLQGICQKISLEWMLSASIGLSKRKICQISSAHCYPSCSSNIRKSRRHVCSHSTDSKQIQSFSASFKVNTIQTDTTLNSDTLET